MSLGYSPLATTLPGSRPNLRRPLPPDEADSMAKRLMGYSTSLLQTGLHVLDTPGSLVRGAIGSAVGARPTPGERTSGRDITDALGITDKHSHSFLSGAAGFLADTALDPLSYLTFGTGGAATTAGKALAKTGATAGWSRRNLLRGFDGVESSLLAAGHTAEEIAHLRNAGSRIATPEMEQAVAAAGDKLAAHEPLAGLVGFSPIPFKAPTHVFGLGPKSQQVAGALDTAGDLLRHGNTLGRWAGAMFSPSVREATGAATQRAMARHGTPAFQAAQTAGRADVADVIGRIHRGLDAGFSEGDLLRAGKQFSQGAVPSNLPSGIGPLARDLGSTMDLANQRRLAEAADLGLPVRPSAAAGLFSDDLARDATHAAEQHARAVAAGRAVLGLIGDEGRKVTSLPADAVPISKVLDDLRFTTSAADGATPVRGALVEAHRQLARQGAGPLSQPLLSDLGRLQSEVDGFALPREVYNDLVRDHVKWNTPSTIQGPLGAFDQVTSAFKNLVYPLWPSSHVRNAVSAGLNNALGGTSLKDHALQLRLMRNTATADELRKVVPDLPASIVNDAAARQWVRDRQYATAKVYDSQTGQLDLDQITNRLNGSNPGQLTPALPGSDRTGGGSLVGDTLRLVGGKLGEQAKLVANKVAHPLQGANPLEMNGISAWSPLRPATFTRGTKDFPALELGRTVGSNIEDLFRGAQWLGAVRQGHTAESAGRLVNATHFDYQNLTDFERNVMRRLAPFYTFSRNNLPAQLDRLVHTPGQVATQMRAMGLGRDSQDYVPDHLASGVAIPTGPEQDGKRQFVSSFGTPLEEALETFRFKGGLPDVRATARSLAGRLNPLLKAPLEQLVDTQFHTGRRLSDIRPSGTVTALGKLIGDDNPQLLSQALLNTPLARFITTADKLVDDRRGPLAKLANMLTGVQVSDVDLDKARRSETAEARNELLRGMPHVASHTSYYARPGERENLTPEEVELLRLQASMGKRPRPIL